MPDAERDAAGQDIGKPRCEFIDDAPCLAYRDHLGRLSPTLCRYVVDTYCHANCPQCARHRVRMAGMGKMLTLYVNPWDRRAAQQIICSRPGRWATE